MGEKKNLRQAKYRRCNALSTHFVFNITCVAGVFSLLVVRGNFHLGYDRIVGQNFSTYVGVYIIWWNDWRDSSVSGVYTLFKTCCCQTSKW